MRNSVISESFFAERTKESSCLLCLLLPHFTGCG